MSAAVNVGATSAAAAAAAERQRQLAEEEEFMTPYKSHELAQDWEFKILRSCAGAFKDPAKLRQHLDEEARAGWQLVEKFDDRRLRLKRPALARELDGKLDFDPYRTHVGLPYDPATARLSIALALGLALVAGLLLAAAAVLD